MNKSWFEGSSALDIAKNFHHTYFPSSAWVNRNGEPERIISILDSKFQEVNFDSNIDIDLFYKYLDTFIGVINNYKIHNKSELNEILKLINDINSYIKLNKEIILNSDVSKLTWLKIDFMKIHELMENRISFINFLWAWEINQILNKINNEFKDTYYLFVPPNSKELPKEVNPLSLVKQLRNDSDIYRDPKKFKVTFEKLKIICVKLAYNQENSLSDLNHSQLKELIGYLELLSDQIETTLKQSDKKWIWESHKRQLFYFSNVYLTKAKLKVRKKLEKIEFPAKISRHYELLKNHWINNKFENSTINKLGTNNDTFAQFKGTFLEFQKYLLMTENLLNEIDWNKLIELKEVLITLKTILLNIIEINKNRWILWQKIYFNAWLILKFIDWFMVKNELATSF